MTDSKNDNNVKVIYTEDFFKDFDGTQEDLDYVVAEIQRMANNGELFENAEEVIIDNIDSLIDEYESFQVVIDKIIEPKRRLH